MKTCQTLEDFYKQVLGFAKHTETDDDLLLYRLVHIDGDKKRCFGTFAQPYTGNHKEDKIL